MSIVVALIIGGIVGWLGAALTGRREGILGSVTIGIVGSIIGGALANVLGSTTHTYLSFSWSGFIWSLIGAVVLSALLNTIQHHHGHHNAGY